MKREYLFETGALKIAPSDSPFWYTSGLIGPYYVNTHFLCGGEEVAAEVLAMIDSEAEQHKTFPAAICEKLESVYSSNGIFAEVIDALCEEARSIISEFKCSYISGGQRRDWFFAPLVAKKLEIPALYIYNDLTVYNQEGGEVSNLKGASVLNVADLLTVGSSYTEKWVPALEEVGGRLVASLNVVDRCQGGKDNLRNSGIKATRSLVLVDESLFDDALAKNYIDEAQNRMLKAYLDDEFESMRSFLMENPEFIQASLQSENERTRKRAELQVEENLYRLNV